MRFEVNTPDCEVLGDTSALFFLCKGQDSPVFYFQLTPLRAGDIGIVIKVYQRQEWLGNARVHTSAHETEIGNVELAVESILLLSEEKARFQTRPAYGTADIFKSELEELQFRYGALTRRIRAIDTDISRALSSLDRQVLEERRSDFVRERRTVAKEISFLESFTGKQLADFPEFAESDDECNDLVGSTCRHLRE